MSKLVKCPECNEIANATAKGPLGEDISWLCTKCLKTTKSTKWQELEHQVKPRMELRTFFDKLPWYVKDEVIRRGLINLTSEMRRVSR
ncbi:MAG: hypothetical protein H6Q67_1720 [Firmicutes bacterium]|nr:hypothetical protein [Bacillota bacterium]